jgi:hypothetical protein
VEGDFRGAVNPAGNGGPAQNGGVTNGASTAAEPKTSFRACDDRFHYPSTSTAVAAPAAKAPAPKAPAADVSGADQLVPLKGAQLKIAENMNLSLSVPTATSQRVVPVKVIDENRRI